MRHGFLFGLGLAALLVAGTTASAVGPTLSHYWDYEEVVATNNTAPIDTARLYVEGSDTYTDQSLSLVIGTLNEPVVGRGDTGVALHIRNGCEYQAVGMASMQSPSFTVEEWYRYDAASNGWANLHTYWGSPVHMQLGGNMLSVAVGGLTFVNTGFATPAAGTWLHIGIVADAALGTVTAYVTPEGQTAVTAYPTNVMNNNNTPLDPSDDFLQVYAGVANGDFMLGSPNKNKYAANGAFDWTAIWDSALTEGTLTDHYLNGLNLHLRGSGPTYHPGDANGDGMIDLQDFGLLKDNFGIPIGGGATWGQGDFNADGGVDLQDFGILKDHFGHSAGDPMVAIPEPATMSLLALAGLGLIRRRK